MSAVDKCARVSRAIGIFFLLGLMVSTAAAAPTGGFLAVLNEQRNFGDSMNTITFFDADTPEVPLFAVYVGREFGSNEWEEPTAITVDQSTGDVYIVAFDSAGPGQTGVPDPVGDIQGDLELLRIPFATVYDHWATNFEGQDVQTLPNPNSFGWGPVPMGTNNSMNLDYVTYANNENEFNAFHANQYSLPGAVEKIGEVVRGNGQDFFSFALDFHDEGTLFLLDDSLNNAGASGGDPLNDHSLRIIEKVTGPAAITTVDRGGVGLNYNNGGYSGTTTSEEWESTLLTFLNMDGATHSEPRSFAYHDNGAGVRGYWIVEGDFSSTTMQSDKVGFLELDANNQAVGFRPMVTGGNPFFLAVSDDPLTDPNSNDGKLHEVFVDSNGDLILVESGFADQTDGIHPTNQEPGVLRIPVDYDNGSGEITFGAWEPKLFLNPTKDPGDTGVEFSQHVTYDQGNNVLYFFSPGGGTETPPNELDIYKLDLNTGVTTSYLNVALSVSLFGDIDTDAVEYFFLAEAGLLGDYNENGVVDAADYTVWQDNFGSTSALPNDDTPGVGLDDFTRWKTNFGDGAGAGGLAAGAVPEPASALLVAIAAIGLWFGRRRMGR